MSAPLITVAGLCVEYHTRGGLLGRGRAPVRVIDRLDLAVYAGETLGVVGESGCGKSTLGRSLLRLAPAAGGTVHFDGTDVLTAPKPALRTLRRDMQIVFQNPFSSLNPRLAVFDLVAEPLRTHATLDRPALAARISDLLREVGLGDEFLSRYPGQLSGGQAQRVVIARALALNPRFLVLDEPTSALDVSVQAQIINLLTQLQRVHGLTYLFISHDLGVVQHISDRIAVMYLGEIVEEGPTEAVFRAPQHPYTQALLAATPQADPTHTRTRQPLTGAVPSIAAPPSGCRFHTRCPVAVARCQVDAPAMVATGNGQRAACHLLEDG